MLSRPKPADCGTPAPYDIQGYSTIGRPPRAIYHSGHGERLTKMREQAQIQALQAIGDIAKSRRRPSRGRRHVAAVTGDDKADRESRLTRPTDGTSALLSSF